MKHSSRTKNDFQPTVNVGKFIKSIKNELDVSYRQLEAYGGVAYNTIETWAAGGRSHQLEFLLRILARLSPSVRHRLIDCACPCFPCLAHPCISRDAMLLAKLNELVDQPTGLSFIAGGTDTTRTFLATAIGHTFAAQRGDRRSIAGYDLHKPNWFLPIDGVEYLQLENRTELVPIALKNKTLGNANMIILNGIISRSAEWLPRIERASGISHVVVADRIENKALLTKFQPPVHLLEIYLDPQRSEQTTDIEAMRIRVKRIAS